MKNISKHDNCYKVAGDWYLPDTRSCRKVRRIY